jgi:hypothetical protein
VTDKPVKLTGDQLDRLTILHRRQIQIAQQKLRHLGVSQKEIDAVMQQAEDNTTPLADGGTIDLEGEQHHLVDYDDTSVTLRKTN